MNRMDQHKSKRFGTSNPDKFNLTIILRHYMEFFSHKIIWALNSLSNQSIYR